MRGTLHGTPTLNTGLLALGSLLASIMGTTGAAMLLIRPLLRANEARRRKVHIVVFFIILVGNIGGALSPLGDPPLFIGFLKGVDFFWTTRVLALPTLALVGALLAIFYVLDRYFWRSENRGAPRRLHAARYRWRIQFRAHRRRGRRGAAVGNLEAGHRVRHRRDAARAAGSGARRRAGRAWRCCRWR